MGTAKPFSTSLGLCNLGSSWGSKASKLGLWLSEEQGLLSGTVEVRSWVNRAVKSIHIVIVGLAKEVAKLGLLEAGV